MTAKLFRILVVLVPAIGLAQQGRVFLPYPETVAIYEFNSVDEGPLPNGTIIPDVGGSGLDAVVIDNAGGTLVIQPGDPNFGPGNREAGKVNYGARDARLVVTDDGGAFEMDETQSFTVEAYMHREILEAGGDWGVLFGTWCSRVPTAGDDDATSLWYGWGLIRFAWPPEDPRGWRWVCSPVNPDGTTNLGHNEQFSDRNFEIPEGYNYLVAVCDRVAQRVTVYLNGVEVSALNLDPAWSFITPKFPGTDTPAPRARFTMLNGENYLEHPNIYKRTMPPPTGYQLDAVRVSKRAMSWQEIQDAWSDIQGGAATPSDALNAIVQPSATQLVPGQCVSFDASESLPGPGAEIIGYEWKIGAGEFAAGESVLETSFPEEAPGGVTVTVRITNDAAQTSEGSATVRVTIPATQGAIAVAVNGMEVRDAVVLAAVGAEITVAPDVVTPWPDEAYACPIADGVSLPAPTITSYSWDLTGDGSENSTEATPPSWIATATGHITLALTVTNSLGAATTITRELSIADHRGNDQVFHTTEATILHFEFNDLPADSFLSADPLEPPDATVDLSKNQLEMTFYDVPDGFFETNHIATVAGPPQFADTCRAVAYLGTSDGHRIEGPRGIVEFDEDVLEMTSERDFSFELYVKPGPSNDPAWSSLAGTFRARWDGSEQASRYGWGIMKTPEFERWTFHFGTGAPGDQGGEQWAGTFTMPQDVYTYLACVVDRSRIPPQARLYVNGVLEASRDLDPTWSFATPPGAPHAAFCIFTRQREPGVFPATIVPGTAVAALRVQEAALTGDEILENWEAILAGVGANAPTVTEPRFIRGYINDDGQINIADVIFLLSYLFASGTAPTCMDAADTNADGQVNIADAIQLLSHLFAGSGPLPAPFPDCGVNPTPSNLPECVFEHCP